MGREYITPTWKYEYDSDYDSEPESRVKTKARKLPVQFSRTGAGVVLRLTEPWPMVLKQFVLRKGFSAGERTAKKRK